MPEMRKAFAKVNGGKPYNPKLTIVICGKRHHTRFYPTEAENADRLGNPRPGTVVDRGVTAVYEFDFFLQGMAQFHFELPFLLPDTSWSIAHGGLQGQTRPTHYYVVHDEVILRSSSLFPLLADYHLLMTPELFRRRHSANSYQLSQLHVRARDESREPRLSSLLRRSRLRTWPMLPAQASTRAFWLRVDGHWYHRQ